MVVLAFQPLIVIDVMIVMILFWRAGGGEGDH